MATQPTIFKWQQAEPAVIVCAVRWYLRYSLSLLDVEELLLESLPADHIYGVALGAAIWRGYDGNLKATNSRGALTRPALR